MTPVSRFENSAFSRWIYRIVAIGVVSTVSVVGYNATQESNDIYNQTIESLANDLKESDPSADVELVEAEGHRLGALRVGNAATRANCTFDFPLDVAGDGIIYADTNLPIADTKDSRITAIPDVPTVKLNLVENLERRCP